MHSTTCTMYINKVISFLIILYMYINDSRSKNLLDRKSYQIFNDSNYHALFMPSQNGRANTMQVSYM